MSAPLSLPGLTQFLSRLEDYPRLLEAVDQGKQTIALSGLSAVHRAYLAAALHQSTGRPLTLVCPDDGEARRLAGDLSALTGAEVPVLPARDFLFHPGAASRQWEHQRLEILARLHRGDCPVLVATVEGLLQRTMPPRGLRRQLPPAPCGPGLSAGGAHRLSGSGGVHPVRPGGGDRAVRPAGGHSGRLLPRPGPAGADGILGG